MPRDGSIQKVLVIGSGPIVIGQAAEFDYAGAQACQALKEEGLEVVLVNSNPATIMTDNAMADEIYIEPLDLAAIKRIIEKERPDSLLSTLGGQTGLTLSMQLAKEGFLERAGVRLLGAGPETIDKAEDRQLFKDAMEAVGEPVIPSQVVETVANALAFARSITYPVIVRPAFTLGGSGGGIASSEGELRQIAANGLRMSPIHQILVEKCVSGWKEIEFEVMRDRKGNCIAVCSMENLDPVGVHTGDSIVVAPTMTLADQEFQMLRSAALRIISFLGVEGGCNCQFALNPDSREYAVIEVNPRVSRSSALASKATGYPIAKVAAKIAVGYTLDEIPNAVTGKTTGFFEPALDYVVVKFPKWPFDKFVYASRALGTQMKATGEVMAIGQNFESALMKAVRGVEIYQDTLFMEKLAGLPADEILHRLSNCDDERLFTVYEAIRRGIGRDEIHRITKIDRWFLAKLENLADMQERLSRDPLDPGLYRWAKALGFPDTAIARLSGRPLRYQDPPAFKMVDTCAAEFSAQTPYFYSVSGQRNEAALFIEGAAGKGRKTILVLGSGPIRIGQGIEFDYASVHCVWALKRAGYQAVIINNNPETVSTDFDTADRLYFEPLTPEDVMRVVRTEQPAGVVAAFGGQTAIRLTKFLEREGVPILGTSADSIDLAEDRGRFDALLEQLAIKRPGGVAVHTEEEAVQAAGKLGYPVLMRPSYVLGGQNMIIAFHEDDIREYMGIILRHNQDSPILIDQYLMGMEFEVDAICDGREVLIPGIMEHIERAGIHSGDSIAVYPARNLGGRLSREMVDCTRRLALALDTKGLVNIQYVVYRGEIYVIEVNPRASRTVPYISKVTGVPVVELATRAMLGEPLDQMGYGTGLYKAPPYVAAKVPVFSFEKLSGLDVQLGPEMKSTGEVLGIGKTLTEALFKGLAAAGYKMKKSGGVLITVRDSDKGEIAGIARKYADLGLQLYATRGTAQSLENIGLQVTAVNKIHEAEDNTKTLLESGKISYIISTSAKGRLPNRDSVKIRRKAVELDIPCLTSLDTANAMADILSSRFSSGSTGLVDINHMERARVTLRFTKMQGCGNDYIYFDCLRDRENRRNMENPESLSVTLSDRRYGIGGDGIVIICPSDTADAKMRMFNLDGSEGRMCGNAIRCVGKYLYDRGLVPKEHMEIETLSGIKRLDLWIHDGVTQSVTVGMGKADFTPANIPVLYDGEEMISQPITVDGADYRATCVSMGNPHCVVFVEDTDSVPLLDTGSGFEHHPMFPERVNTEFVQVLDSHTLKMRVWERGSGETWACGTGACASAAAAVRCGFCKPDTDITVKLKGGDLIVRFTDGEVTLTGDAVTIFDGSMEI